MGQGAMAPGTVLLVAISGQVPKKKLKIIFFFILSRRRKQEWKRLTTLN